MLYANPDYAKFEKNIYIIHDHDHFNVIDSIKAFCGKYYFCEACVDIFSYRCDHYPCPLFKTVHTSALTVNDDYLLLQKGIKANALA